MCRKCLADAICQQGNNVKDNTRLLLNRLNEAAATRNESRFRGGLKMLYAIVEQLVDENVELTAKYLDAIPLEVVVDGIDGGH